MKTMSDTPPEVTSTESDGATQNGRRGRSPRSIIGLLVLIAILATGGVFGYRFWQRMGREASTDDAYLTADMTQIAPQVSGTIQQVLVHENELVKPGQLLVVLDDAPFRVAVAQARANLAAAVAAAHGAEATVGLTAETGSAQVTQAQGVVEQAGGGIGSARAELQRSAAGVTRSTAAVKEAEVNVGSASAGVEAARANRRQAQAAVDAAQAHVGTANAGVKAAEAGVAAAVADANNAAADAKRYESLVVSGAISKQVYDRSVANASMAQARADNARQQVEIARSNVEGATAELEAARQKLSSADAAVTQAEAQLTGAREHVQTVAADVGTAEAQRQVAVAGVQQAQAKRAQAMGQLRQAKTAPRQVAVSASAQSQAAARIAQAQAALDDALLKLSYTRIAAPVAGQISKKTAEVGALVQLGTPLMALVQNGGLWVVANYKETQLSRMQPGAPAHIRVDALHGHVFGGHVNSIAAATGATFALLPPENASGNFTRIVQRVPVKITLDPGQPDLDRLRGGMSAVAIVELH